MGHLRARNSPHTQCSQGIGNEKNKQIRIDNQNVTLTIGSNRLKFIFVFIRVYNGDAKLKRRQYCILILDKGG